MHSGNGQQVDSAGALEIIQDPNRDAVTLTGDDGFIEGPGLLGQIRAIDEQIRFISEILGEVRSKV